MRLARFESAGVTERMYQAVAAVALKTEERAWAKMHLGKPLTLPSGTDRVTTGALQAQEDLVERLHDEDTRFEEVEEFVAFVWKTKLAGSSNGNGDGDSAECDGRPEKARACLTSLSATDREDLEKTFRLAMVDLLKTMYEERAHESANETAVERSLIPDNSELEKIMRYETTCLAWWSVRSRCC